jgi:hypothetical protein
MRWAYSGAAAGMSTATSAAVIEEKKQAGMPQRMGRLLSYRRYLLLRTNISAQHPVQVINRRQQA